MAEAGEPMEKQAPESDETKVSELFSGVRSYDFRISRKLTQAQRVQLGAVHTRLTALLTKRLPEIIHCPVEIAFLGLEQIQGSNFQPVDQIQHITTEISLGEHRGKIYFLWPRPMAFYVIERMLGGTGNTLYMEKEISGFEGKILRRYTQTIFKALQDSVEKIKMESQGELVYEGQPSFSDQLPYEVLLIGRMNFHMNQHEGKLTLIYPFNVVKSWFAGAEPEAELKSALNPKAGGDAAILPGLAKAKVRVSVCMEPTLIKVSDFTSLQVGDCLQLNHTIREPLAIFVGESIKFRGSLGCQGKQLGIKITSTLYSPLAEKG